MKWLFRCCVVLTPLVLFVLNSGDVSAKSTEIKQGSPEYQHILDAIQILKEADGDSLESPSPMWLANNIKTFLDAGKIREREQSGAYGSNVDKGGTVFIDFNHFDTQIMGSWDKSTDIGYKKLLILAQTLAHEKYHSENHGIYSRVTRQNESEAEAYHHELRFIDEMALAMSEKCGMIKNDQPGKKLQCYKKLRIIYQSKKDLIRVFNASQFATNGHEVKKIMVDTIDRVVEQLDLVIPRWEAFVRQAEEHPDTIGRLQNEFEQHYAAAHVAFHSDLINAEILLLDGLSAMQMQLMADTRQTVRSTMAAIGNAVRQNQGYPAGTPFSALITVRAQAGLLTGNRSYFSVGVFADNNFIPALLTTLDSPPRFKVVLSQSTMQQIANAENKTMVARQLLDSGELRVELFSLAPTLRRYQLLSTVIGILSLLFIAIWVIHRRR